MSPQQQAANEAGKFVTKFNDIILFPTITLLSAVAFLVFIWGCVEYFIGAANETKRQDGVKHITYGIIGLVVMVSAFAILSIFTATFGLEDKLECANNPSGPGCEDVFSLPPNIPPSTGPGSPPNIPPSTGPGSPPNIPPSTGP